LSNACRSRIESFYIELSQKSRDNDILIMNGEVIALIEHCFGSDVVRLGARLAHPLPKMEHSLRILERGNETVKYPKLQKLIFNRIFFLHFKYIHVPIDNDELAQCKIVSPFDG
jgi:hypothetical protein